LTPRQKTALRNPCFEAEEVRDPAFGWRAIDPTITAILTLNIGLE
jgi:hypothetical protein